MAVTVAVDWAKDGSWASVGDDVTLRVRGTVTCGYGRDQSTSVSPVVSGTGALQLDNASRDYSPRNTASPLYGKVKPARPVLIQRTVGATTYTIMRGLTNDAPLNPDLNDRKVGLTLLDPIAGFRGVDLSTPLYAGMRTGEAVGLVLDALGWTAGRDLDAGASVLPWWWAEGIDGLTALTEIVTAEGPPALLTIGSAGEIVFRDRHHRLLRSASLTSQGTWRGIGAEPVMHKDFAPDEAWSQIINSVSASVDVRAPTDVTVVWSSTATVNLADGETKLISVTTTDPFLNAIAPTVDDMTVTYGTVTAVLTRDSGAATTIRLTATGASQVTSLQLRAISVLVATTQQVTAADPVSVNDYGPRGYPATIKLAHPGDVEAILSTAVAARSQPLTLLSVKFQVGSGAPAARIAAVLARNIGDRVTVVEPESQINGDFFIERIEHTINGEVDHVVTFGLEAAPPVVSNVFTFDGGVGHRFDEGVFGNGLDDPAAIFIFDSAVAGHRFDEGVFAT